MSITMDVARCLHGETKGKQAMDVMCRAYLANRLVGTYERQLIRDRITELGKDAVPMMLKAVDNQLLSVNAEVDKQISDKKAAQEFRKEQARAILREIMVVSQEDGERSVEIIGQPPGAFSTHVGQNTQRWSSVAVCPLRALATCPVAGSDQPTYRRSS